MTTAEEADARVEIAAADILPLRAAGLTVRQASIFLYIFEYTRINGFQPSNRDIGARFGNIGTNAVAGNLKVLSRERWIDLSEGASRALRFLRGPDGEPFLGFIYPM